MMVYKYHAKQRETFSVRDDTIIPFSLNLRKGSNKYEMAMKEILEFYFDNKDPLLNKDNIYRVRSSYLRYLACVLLIFAFQLYTDNYFLFEVYRTAKYHLETSTTPVYFYNFDLDTNLNLMKKLSGITEKGKKTSRSP